MRRPRQAKQIRRLGPDLRLVAATESLAHADERAAADAAALELIELIVPQEQGDFTWSLPGAARTRRERAGQACAALVRNWAKLSPDVARLALATDRDGILGHAGSIAGTLEEEPTQIATARSLAAMLDAVSPAEGAALVPPLLSINDRSVFQRAEDLLLRAARNASKGKVSNEIIHAIDRGIVTYPEHGRRSTLLAGLLLLAADRSNAGPVGLTHGPLAPIARWLDPARADHPIGRAMRSVFRRADEPSLRAAAIRWLTDERLARLAIDRIAEASNTADHEALLNAAPLLTRPARSRRLAAIAGSAGSASPLPREKQIPEIQVTARRLMPLAVTRLATGRDDRRSALAPLLADADPLTRLNALRFADPSDRADYTLDTDPAVARAALIAWSDAGLPPALDDTRPIRRIRSALITKLHRSSHPAVRDLATQDAARIDPWANTPAGRLLARRLLNHDPEQFIERARERLLSGTTAVRTSTMITLRSINIADKFADELCALSRIDAATMDGAERVVATAVATLAEFRDHTADALRAARDVLDHRDPRVCANAVESVASLDRTNGPPEAIFEFKADERHRVRANALRELLRVPAGQRLYEPKVTDNLSEMLTDDRPMHRLAATWLAERVLCGGGRTTIGREWEPLTRRVAVIASDDEEPAVRRRATHCARRLLGELRSSWVDHNAPEPKPVINAEPQIAPLSRAAAAGANA